VWNERRFVSHVSPHEALQAVARVSQRRFRIGATADPQKFLAWLLHTLHRQMGGEQRVAKSKVASSSSASSSASSGGGSKGKVVKGGKQGSVVHDAFKGELAVTTLTPLPEDELKMVLRARAAKESAR
jgi:hypothetical protein